MIKKIIFDLDYTLLFLSDEWEENYKRFVDKYNLSISANELFLSIGNFEKSMKNIVVSKQKLSEYVSNDLSIDFTTNMILELLEIYDNTSLLNTDTIYDILNYLSEKYELIAYTNWFTDDQIKRLSMICIIHIILFVLIFNFILFYQIYWLNKVLKFIYLSATIISIIHNVLISLLNSHMIPKIMVQNYMDG